METLRADLDDTRPRAVAWDDYERWASEQWAVLLASDPAEAPVQRFLEAHPAFIPGGLGDVGPGGHHGPHLGGVFREPPLKGLNRDQRPDFMWITRSTSLVTPICIEIEAPGRAWYTKAGDPTAELSHAREQINRWRAWFSEAPNQEIFKEQYLKHQYSNRQLLPQYVLVFGRRREFEVESDQHVDADTLRRVRDFANRPDMQAMTFDSLRPRWELRNMVTLSMTKHGPSLYAVPPTFTTGPAIIELASTVRTAREAVEKTPCWSQERKDYVVARWERWKRAGDGPNGPRTGEIGE